jgi:hypothetical protein
MKFNSQHLILLLSIIILILLSITLHKVLNNEEYFRIIDDDEIDFSDPSQFIETRSQLTPEEIKMKKELRQELASNAQLEKQLNMYKGEYTPDYSGQSNCTTRCDCCWKNSTSTDRITACHKKYKQGSSQLNECLSSNSKYAHEACKSSFGKGLIFKSC